MAAHVGRLTAPVLLGVGAAFDARFLLANIRHRPSMMVADW
jgi:hypothetical protein